MARARLQEKEEETEIKIFNEHKDRIKKLMAQKQMVSSKMMLKARFLIGRKHLIGPERFLTLTHFLGKG